MPTGGTPTPDGRQQGLAGLRQPVTDGPRQGAITRAVVRTAAMLSRPGPSTALLARTGLPPNPLAKSCRAAFPGTQEWLCVQTLWFNDL
jgi:hypothetical protein